MARKVKPGQTRNIEVLSARVSQELYRQVYDLSKVKDLTVTQIVRASIRDYLAKNHGGQNEVTAT